MLGFWDWPEGERRGGQRWVGQKAGCQGAGNRLGVLGRGTLCWGLFSRALLCDPGEVTVSLWALSLQSEGLEARLLFPLLNTVSGAVLYRDLCFCLYPFLLPSLPLFIHSFPPTPCLPLPSVLRIQQSSTRALPSEPSLAADRCLTASDKRRLYRAHCQWLASLLESLLCARPGACLTSLNSQNFPRVGSLVISILQVKRLKGEG